MAINKIKYRNKVEVIANAERGNIKPVLSHLRNLIFLLIIFAINLNRHKLKLFKLEGYNKST